MSLMMLHHAATFVLAQFVSTVEMFGTQSKPQSAKGQGCYSQTDQKSVSTFTHGFRF
jgi:hypothetical protein